MNNSSHDKGPGKGLLSTGQRIIKIVVGMVETRLKLAVIELEEEKTNLIQLLMMLGLTIIFTVFGLMSLVVLLIWAVDAEYRLYVMAGITTTFLVFALVFAIWTLKKSRKSTLLRHTRRELARDKALLEED